MLVGHGRSEGRGGVIGIIALIDFCRRGARLAGQMTCLAETLGRKKIFPGKTFLSFSLRLLVKRINCVWGRERYGAARERKREGGVFVVLTVYERRSPRPWTVLCGIGSDCLLPHEASEAEGAWPLRSLQPLGQLTPPGGGGGGGVVREGRKEVRMVCGGDPVLVAGAGVDRGGGLLPST